MNSNYRLLSDGVFVGGAEASGLINEGFGTPVAGGVELDPLEALYLIQRDKIKLPADRDTLAALSSMRSSYWNVYAVYQDLASQGKKVKVEDENTLRLSEGDKLGFIPLSFDQPLTVENLKKRISKITLAGWTPVLAIVDDHGTPTYYSVEIGAPSLETFTAAGGD